MSKITIENKKGKITIINRLSYPETVNERIYNAITSGMFEGFLPLSIVQKRNETRIECVIQGLIPLTQYFYGFVNRNMFLDFVHQIALLIKDCEKNMINANNMDLQSDKIFIDPTTKSVKCIFWPVVNNQKDNPPYLFLKQLPYNLNFNPHENSDYLEIYKSFFCGINPFSINSFEKMISKLSGKDSINRDSTSYKSISSLLGNDAKYERKESSHKRKNIEYNPFSNYIENTIKKETQEEFKNDINRVFCSCCGAENNSHSIFCYRCRTNLRSNQPIDTVDYNRNNTNNDSTINHSNHFVGTGTFLNNVSTAPIYPVLTQVKTKKEYIVDKPLFKIGTEQNYCDLIINNNYISRNHAVIITRCEKYYIVDCNSTNKTFVNGNIIPPEKEIEIFSGTHLRFATEDFIFSI